MATGLEAPAIHDAADCKVEGRKAESFATSILDALGSSRVG